MEVGDRGLNLQIHAVNLISSEKAYIKMTSQGI